MDTKVNYAEEKGGYYKVLVGLLLLTVVTLVQPGMFLTNATFGVQMFIGLIKAWMILMYYMHLKGEKLIMLTVIFSLFLVTVFFTIVGIDVANFQYGDVSHITTPASDAAHAAPAHH